MVGAPPRLPSCSAEEQVAGTPPNAGDAVNDLGVRCDASHNPCGLRVGVVVGADFGIRCKRADVVCKYILLEKYKNMIYPL